MGRAGDVAELTTLMLLVVNLVGERGGVGGEGGEGKVGLTCKLMFLYDLLLGPHIQTALMWVWHIYMGWCHNDK